MKKVFRIWKYVEHAFKCSKSTYFEYLVQYVINNLKNKNSWIYQCDGKSLEECEYLGYKINDEWLVEEDEQSSTN